MSELRKTMLALSSIAALGILGAPQARSQVPEAEVYRLASVGGQALPAVVEEEGDCRDELHAATLTLAADGTWTLETEVQEVCGDETSAEEDQEDGTYRIEGESIQFLDEDGEPLSTDEDDAELDIELLREATRTDNGLRVLINDQETVLEFTR